MWSFPLLLVPFVLFNLLAFFAPALPAAAMAQFQLLSQATLVLSWNDGLVILSLLLLYVEVFKSTRATTSSIIDHLFSMFLFVACLIEFLSVQRAGTSTFFLITLMTMIDVVAGFTVSISSARRDFGIER